MLCQFTQFCFLFLWLILQIFTAGLTVSASFFYVCPIILLIILLLLLGLLQAIYSWGSSLLIFNCCLNSRLHQPSTGRLVLFFPLLAVAFVMTLWKLSHEINRFSLNLWLNQQSVLLFITELNHQRTLVLQMLFSLMV